MADIYSTEPLCSGKVCLVTSVGDIDVELWTREAPVTCKSFLQHCLDGYYDGMIFHRVIKDFMAQTGCPLGNGEGGEGAYEKTFRDEFHSRLRFNRRGLMGMANAGKDDNGSQFFLTLDATNDLNKKTHNVRKSHGPDYVQHAEAERVGL
jgi:peptidyl-prolyl cis-trans isomerase SDCCAG10